MTAHPGIILAVAATVIYNLGFIWKSGLSTACPPSRRITLWRLARTLFTAPAWLAGFLLICGGLMLQVLVLSLEPLTVAQPLQASGVVVTILFSRLVLHERLGPRRARVHRDHRRRGRAAQPVQRPRAGRGSGHPRRRGRHRGGRGSRLPGGPGHLLPGPAGRPAGAGTGRDRRQLRPAAPGWSTGSPGLRSRHCRPSIFATPHARGALLAAAVASPYLYAVLASSAIGMCLFQVALQRSPASIVMPISLVISTGYLVVIGSWLFHERLPASPALLAMRLGGGGRRRRRTGHPDRHQRTGRRSPWRSDDVASRAADRAAAHDPRREDRRSLPGQQTGAPRREPDEPGPPAAEPAGLPDRQAGAAVPGRVRRPVQPATAPPLPDP